MEKVKEKATNLVDKVTGKSHPHDNSHLHDQNVDPTTQTQQHHHPHFQPQPQPQSHGNVPATNVGENKATTHQHSGPLHTGAAASSAAVPHKPMTERTAYEQQYLSRGSQNQNPMNTTADPTAAPAMKATSHGVDPRQSQQQQQQQPPITTTGLPSTAIGATQQQHPSAPTGVMGATGNNNHIPTYAQNIAPTAAGVVPTAHPVTDPSQQVLGDSGLGRRDPTHPVNTNPFPEESHHSHRPTTQMTDPTKAGNGRFPDESHHSHHPTTQMTDPTKAGNTSVPAMGAPGTTTTAGTHLPGQYQSGSFETPPTPPSKV